MSVLPFVHFSAITITLASPARKRGFGMKTVQNYAYFPNRPNFSGGKCGEGRKNVEGDKDKAYSNREDAGAVERTALAERKAVAGREKEHGKQGERPYLGGRKAVPPRFTAGGENIHGDR